MTAKKVCKKQGKILKISGGGGRFFWVARIYTPVVYSRNTVPEYLLLEL